MATTLWLSKIFVVGVLLALTPSTVGQGGGGEQPGGEGGEAPVNTTSSTDGNGDGGEGEPPIDMTSSTGGAGNGDEEAPIDMTSSVTVSTSTGTLTPFEPIEIDFSMYTDTCNQLGNDAHYEVFFSGTGDTMVRQALSDSGCPNHVNYGILHGEDNHFSARNIPTNTSIPAYPMLQAGGASTSLSLAPGAVGILVNGVSVYGPWATEEATDYTNTAFAVEGDTFDACGAHSTVEGWYHFHNTPGCLLEQVATLENVTSSDHSPFLGWSYDGFPIYAHRGPEATSMLSCGTDGAHDTYCLDECNGYEGLLPDIDAFAYRYYLTCGYTESFYPVTVGCYRGCCPEGIECDVLVEACSTDAEAGYTDEYEPELGTVVTDQYEVSFLEGSDAAYINSSTGVNCPAYYGETTITQTPVATPTMMPLAEGETLAPAATPSPVSTSTSDTTGTDNSTSSPTSSDDLETNQADSSNGFAPPSPTSSLLACVALTVAAVWR